MKKNNLLKTYLEAINNHEPLIINYGTGNTTKKEIKEITYWNKSENQYDSETGKWDIELLLEIAKGEVDNMSIELMANE